MDEPVNRRKLEQVASESVPMLRDLVRKAYDRLTVRVNAVEACVQAAIDGTGTVDAMQDSLVELLGAMTGASHGLAINAAGMSYGTSLEPLVRDGLFDPRSTVAANLGRPPDGELN